MFEGPEAAAPGGLPATEEGPKDAGSACDSWHKPSRAPLATRSPHASNAPAHASRCTGLCCLITVGRRRVGRSLDRGALAPRLSAGFVRKAIYSTSAGQPNAKSGQQQFPKRRKVAHHAKLQGIGRGRSLPISQIRTLPFILTRKEAWAKPERRFQASRPPYRQNSDPIPGPGLRWRGRILPAPLIPEV